MPASTRLIVSETLSIDASPFKALDVSDDNNCVGLFEDGLLRFRLSLAESLLMAWILHIFPNAHKAVSNKQTIW